MSAQLVFNDTNTNGKKYLYTDQAPQVIGTYSQAVQVDRTIYLSGQIGLNPTTMTLATPAGEQTAMEAQLRQVFENMKAVAAVCGATLKDIDKLTIYIADMSSFPIVNQVMADYFTEPFPARSTVQVSGLPKDALIEVEGIINF